MADPLSIASGVAGLISLGLTLCNGLHTYFSAIKDRNKDVEIVTKDLSLLRFNIETIKSSTSKLANHNALAADGVNLGLKNCESQLKSLEKFIQDLTSADGLSGAKQQWRKQKMIARYPFDQKKLAQLQEQLSKANHTLSTFIHTFNLEVNIGISDNLQIMNQDMKANDASVMDLLGSLSTRLDVIGPTVQRTEMAIATLPLRTRDQTVATETSLSLSQGVVAEASETKSASPSGQQPCDLPCEGDLRPRYLRDTDAEARLCNKLTITECTCKGPSNRPAPRRSSRIYQFWGGLAISRQGYSQSSHRPGCIFYNNSPKKSWKTTLTYSGLRSILSQSLIITASQDYPTGSYSISFGLQPCNIVESSPAFRLFDLGTDLTYFKALQKSFEYIGPIKTTKKLIQDLRVIYSSGNASPFDVDQDSNNIAHRSLEFCLQCVDDSKGYRSYDKANDAICMLLSYMFEIGVPVTAYNFDQRTVLDVTTEWYWSSWMLPRLYSLVTSRDPAFCIIKPSCRRKEYYSGISDEKLWLDRLSVWYEYPEISEAFGFPDLFLAVLQKDLSKLETILKDPKLDASFFYKDLYQRNILHLSSNWAAGLRLLLEHEALNSLLNALSDFGFSPLDDGLIYSKTLCNALDQWTLCDDCTCYVAVKLLLEADCSVTVGELRPETLRACSLRARMLFFQHLRNRRERLRDISLAYLPAEVLSQYGVTADSLPDATAMVLWDELQERADYLANLPVVLSDSLKGYLGLGNSSPESFFSYPHPVKVSELALSYGFQPFDETGVQPLMSQLWSSVVSEPERDIAYADWLLQHDLKNDLSVSPFEVSATHRLGTILGERLRNLYSQHHPFPTDLVYEFKDLFSVVCSSEDETNLPCPCITGIYNRPLAYLMSTYMNYYSSVHSGVNLRQRIEKYAHVMTLLVNVIEDLACGLETAYLAKCAVHILTMEFLDIRHLPSCCNLEWCRWGVSEALDYQGEWVEILDEDRLLIQQLHDLDEEFGEEFQRQNVSIASFLQGHWLNRMEEVGRDLDRALTDDYRSDLCEVGVVLDEDQDPSTGPDMYE